MIRSISTKHMEGWKTPQLCFESCVCTYLQQGTPSMFSSQENFPSEPNNPSDFSSPCQKVFGGETAVNKPALTLHSSPTDLRAAQGFTELFRNQQLWKALADTAGPGSEDGVNNLDGFDLGHWKEQISHSSALSNFSSHAGSCRSVLSERHSEETAFWERGVPESPLAGWMRLCITCWHKQWCSPCCVLAFHALPTCGHLIKIYKMKAKTFCHRFFPTFKNFSFLGF